MRGLLHVDYVALPNLIADSPIVPEMLLHHCTPVNVLERLLDILPGHPGRQAQLDGYARMRAILGRSNAADTAAEAITGDLMGTPQRSTVQ